MFVSFKNAKFSQSREIAKRFLDETHLHREYFKAPTYKILDDILTTFILPQKGEQLRIRTQQQINLISLVLKILDVHKAIDELIIGTYTFNREANSILFDLLKQKKINRLLLFLSSSYAFREPEYYRELKEKILEYQARGYFINCLFGWLHLKITLCQCRDDYYHIEGSMNYSSSSQAEQLLFENRKSIYEMDRAFFHDVIAQKKNKALEVVGDFLE